MDEITGPGHMYKRGWQRRQQLELTTASLLLQMFLEEEAVLFMFIIHRV